MNFEIFLICGGLLVLGALVISAVGAKSESFPPSRGVMFGIAGVFAALVVGTAAFAWIHAEDEKSQKEAEVKNEEKAAESAGGAEKGMGGMVVRALSSPADGSLVYVPDGLKAPAGMIEIVYTNPSAIPHNVAVEFQGGQLGETKTVTKGKATLELDLEPGEYVFYCTIPGHRQAGMQGDLLVTGRVN